MMMIIIIIIVIIIIIIMIIVIIITIKLYLGRVTSISRPFLMHRCPLRVYLRLEVF